MKYLRFTLLMFAFMGALNGFADDCKHLWFSQKQQDSLYLVDNTTKAFDTSKLRNIYGKLENGDIVQYTEMNDVKEYTSYFDDAKYIGCGNYERTEIINNLDTKNYHANNVLYNEKLYKEKMLKNYEQLNKTYEVNSELDCKDGTWNQRYGRCE